MSLQLEITDEQIVENTDVIPGILINGGKQLLLLPRTTLSYPVPEVKFPERVFRQLDNSKKPIKLTTFQLKSSVTDFDKELKYGINYFNQDVKIIINQNNKFNTKFEIEQYLFTDILKNSTIKIKVYITLNNVTNKNIISLYYYYCDFNFRNIINYSL